MTAEPREVNLTLTPHSRYDAIDVAARVREEFGDALAGFRRALYCSLHTTAGYLEQSLSSRLDNRRERLDPFMRAFQGLFPPGADYRHDRLDLRHELSEVERRCEPRNADSHLAFIGSGLRSCVTYLHRPGEPVYLMDLDGVHAGQPRIRRTRVLGYSDEETVAKIRCEVPVSRHPIDSVNLADSRVGVLACAHELVSRHGVARGRIDIALAASEREAGVTVNEYETLLMRHDLAEVLADPLKFAASTGRRMLRDPLSIPSKSWGYARYDVVQVLNELMDALKVTESALERLLARVMAVPARRFLRLKRSLSMLVSDGDGIVRGTYQNPILIQWAGTPQGSRSLELTVTRFR
ncbi:MAG: hypothetical protein A2Y78_11880 [Acidobacteria bacterium RBG_13_68_16]|nr:MAG: hypothetical protein A2Y78_11880 [Acidobacteria bacterium RBG_13_68_16]